MGSLPGHSRARRVPCSTQEPSLVSSLFLIPGLPHPRPRPGLAPQCLPLAPHPRLPRETLAFREELDVLKFLCKDVWAAVFQKQMDSLRTNHQVRAHARCPKEPGKGIPARDGCSTPSPAVGTCPSWEAGTGPLGASVPCSRGSQEAAVGRGSCFQPPSRPRRLGPGAGRRPLAAGGTSPRPDAACPDPVLVPIRSLCAGAPRAAPRAWAAASHHHPGRSRTQWGKIGRAHV